MKLLVLLLLAAAAVSVAWKTGLHPVPPRNLHPPTAAECTAAWNKASDKLHGSVAAFKPVNVEVSSEYGGRPPRWNTMCDVQFGLRKSTVDVHGVWSGGVVSTWSSRWVRRADFGSGLYLYGGNAVARADGTLAFVGPRPSVTPLTAAAPASR